jgi:hypothetical protein
LNGEFKWLNIQDLHENLLNETGFYFGRYEVFARPLKYDEEATMFLYRRCPQTEPQVCEICGDNAAAVTSAVGLAADVASADIVAATRTITVTLTSCLGCETGAPITLTDNSASAYSGVIGDASAAPTYVLAMQADMTGKTFTAAGSATVTCA